MPDLPQTCLTCPTPAPPAPPAPPAQKFYCPVSGASGSGGSTGGVAGGATQVACLPEWKAACDAKVREARSVPNDDRHRLRNGAARALSEERDSTLRTTAIVRSSSATIGPGARAAAELPPRDSSHSPSDQAPNRRDTASRRRRASPGCRQVGHPQHRLPLHSSSGEEIELRLNPSSSRTRAS